ncbi:MAG: MinD/ParA family protein [Spartobacteria bacterium]|nr:MinD/ParA family protein [Spartobacteria bacterium]
MNDQASTLRNMMITQKAATMVAKKLRCLAVGSGKGGVGKTMISIGLACALARMEYRVLIIDADLGLANVDLQIGVNPEFTLMDVVYGNCPVEQAITKTPYGVDLLAAASGSPELVDMGGARRDMLVNQLIRFAARYDWLIIDGAAGIGQSIVSFFAAAPEVAIVVANEPTSLMDAYSLIKVLRQQPSPPILRLVINSVQNLNEGEELAARMNAITKRFLNVEIPVGGIITYDPLVGNAIRARMPVSAYAPRSLPARRLEELARLLVRDGQGRRGKEAPDGLSFFNKLAEVSLGGLTT